MAEKKKKKPTKKPAKKPAMTIADVVKSITEPGQFEGKPPKNAKKLPKMMH